MVLLRGIFENVAEITAKLFKRRVPTVHVEFQILR